MGNRQKLSHKIEYLETLEVNLIKEKSKCQLKYILRKQFEIIINYQLFKHLSSFLTIKENLNFCSTCKKLQLYSQQYQGFYATHLYTSFLEKQLEFILELQFFETPDFCLRRKQENLALLVQTENPNWHNLIKDLTQLSKFVQYQLLLCRTKFSELMTILTTPQCPRPTLRRETIGIYCDSDYQGMLSTKLEAQQKCGFKIFDFQIPSLEFLKCFKANKLEILSEALQMISSDDYLSQHFISLRWYNSPKNANQIKMPFLLEFFTYFDTLFQKYTEVLLAYFKEQLKNINAYNFLNEYVIYFEAFTNTLIEIDSNISIVEDIINEVHQQQFPYYPQFPKFSFQRLIINRWINNIYYSELNLQEVLSDYALIIINQLREKQLQTFFETEIQSHLLQENYFKFQSNTSLLEIQKTYLTHQFYNTKELEAQQLVYRFFRSIQDISVNEITIHWFGHSECEFEKAFIELENIFLISTKEYYKILKSEVFKDDLKQFLKFMEIDTKLTQQICYETLLVKTMKIKQNIIEESLSKQFSKQIKLFLLNNQFEGAKNMQDSYTPKNNTMQSLLLSSLNFNFQVEEEKYDNFFSTNQMNQIEFHLVDPIDRIIRMVLSESKLQSDELSSISTNESISQFNQMFDSEKLFISQEKCQRESITKSQNDTYHSGDQQNQLITDDLIIKIKQYLYEQGSQYTELIENYQEYYSKFDQMNKIGEQKDQELAGYNEERQIPKNLTEGQKKFYYVSCGVNNQSLEENRFIPVQEEKNEFDQQMEEEDDLDPLDLKLPTLNKQISKNEQALEEYNSEDDDGMQFQ